MGPTPPPTWAPTPGPPDPIVDIIKKFPTEYLKVCSTIKTGETILWDKKVLCAFELFEKRYETPKCLLCPEVCNDKKVAFSTKVADKTPTNMNKMKSWKKRVTVARKELCKAISATNGEAACKSSLFSNKKNKIELYVYTLCDKACTPYFKGKKIEIDEKDCKYAKPPKPGPVPPVEPDPVPPPVPDPVPDPVPPPTPPPTPGPPDPIVDIIKKFPTEYLKVCSTIKTGETILWDKKVLCAFELFEKRY